MAKILRKALIQVENSVKNDVKIRKEVVFFPYKASMWDSLESVYLSAIEDEDCDAYCVPERYFAKNLCNDTDRLVYISCFILNEIEPDDIKAAKESGLSGGHNDRKYLESKIIKKPDGTWKKSGDRIR